MLDFFTLGSHDIIRFGAKKFFKKIIDKRQATLVILFGFRSFNYGNRFEGGLICRIPLKMLMISGGVGVV